MELGRVTIKHVGQVAAGVLAALGLAVLFRPTTPDHGAGVLPVARRQTMPEFSMAELNGSTWALAANRGKVVLVNFWATWCPPCREEIPGFVRLSQRYQGRGLEMAGISMDEGGVAQVRQFVKAAGIPYPILMPPPDSPFLNTIASLPTTFLVDKGGKIAKIYSGAVGEAEVGRDLDQLLAEP